MTDWHHLLSATDLSAPARHAAERAAFIAATSGVPLTLIHATPAGALGELRAWLGPQTDAARRLQSAARLQLETLASELAAQHRIQVRAVEVEGTVLDEILLGADAVDAGLIVLGARGAGWLRRLAIGTTSERLLRRTRRPILVVRQVPHEAYRRVLVATDFSPAAAPVVDLARRAAPDAHLILFHAFEVPFHEKLQFAGVDPATIEHYRERGRAMALQRLHGLARDHGLLPSRWEALVVEGDASLRLVQHEQERDADLVVVGKHGQSAAEDLLLGSVTKHLLSEGSVDVLVATSAPGTTG
jgi:nucleotide-binding universal stress UspA family protein